MKKWIEHGKRFGYPECCIESFVIRVSGLLDGNLDRPDKIQILAGNGTGFIPCSNCSLKVVSGECMLIDLIKNRKNRNKFPNT